MDQEISERLDRLAREVLTLSRDRLLVELRFMDAALSRLKLLASREFSLATDGRSLAYEPRYVLRRYRTDRAITVRDYLHVILHCVYRHMFIHIQIDQAAWDLACDIAVEYTITGLGIKTAAAGRETKQRAVYRELEKEIGRLTAEKLYRHFLDREMPPLEMADLRGLFYADDHRLWYMPEAALPGQPSVPGTGDGGDEDGISFGGEPRLGSESDWQSVSQRMQMDMEAFSGGRGLDPRAMLQNLREVNREKYDYAAFLRRFAVMGEVTKIDPDEFDYVFYTYGLELYGNMPLIEPLEYREVKRIREFVIAIDTSGSVAGETVQKFVQKTWNILKSTESFFTKINLHILQCDATIQEDAKITSQQEFDEYIKTMKIRGLGGTDFRPVFGYVDWLLEKKEFMNLKGLIYFTDGWGTFPARMPEYRTAFVFLDEEDNNYEVPPWAIRLILRREDIRD